MFNNKIRGVLTSLCLLCFVVSSTSEAKPFVQGRLIGQLGNQFFQIAATVSVALDNGANPVFPDLISSNEFNIPLNYKKVFSHLNVTADGPIQYNYNDPLVIFRPIPYHPNMCIQGWFQSEKYFIRHKREILKLFEPTKEISQYLKATYGHIIEHPKTVAIHVRSYLQEDPNQITHPTLKKKYFEEAIHLFPEDSLFVVCSNCIEWCKKAFSDIPRSFIYIENEPHYHDLYLMSLCKHNIIANSSFSWWSAYMNANPNKIVVAPRHWFNPSCGIDYSDVVPNGWVILD